MNKVIICGNLTKDPETFTSNNGVNVTRFTIAVRKKLRNENGEFDADFFNCVAFNKLGTDVVMKYTQKGSRVIVSGRMESSHKDEDGKRITYWNLVVDDIELVKTSLENEQAPKQTQQQDPTPIDDDGLPF